MRSTFVPGKPVGQGSKRHVGNGRLIESSHRVHPWRQVLAGLARVEMQGTTLDYGGAWVVTIVVVIDRPKSHRLASGALKPSAPDFPLISPDIDKVARAVLDALTGVVFADDKQVTTLVATRQYGQTAGTHISWKLQRSSDGTIQQDGNLDVVE
jgi:crossover junction endodeoxyribonuclease RusA